MPNLDQTSNPRSPVKIANCTSERTKNLYLDPRLTSTPNAGQLELTRPIPVQWPFGNRAIN